MNKLMATLFVFAASVSLVCADTISVPLPECTATFQQTLSGTRISIPDYAVSASPGNPALPYKEMHVLLPPNADPSSVEVSLSGRASTPLDGKYDIAPSPPVMTIVDGKTITDWGTGKLIENGHNTLVYGSDCLYPVSNVELSSVGNMRQWRLVRFKYYPFTYNPYTKRLWQITEGEINVSYSLSASISAYSSASTYPIDVLAEKSLADLAVNYDQASDWYPTSSTEGTHMLSATSASNDSETQAATDYVILTTTDVVAASTKLQAFVNHKTNRGYSVAVITQSAWGGGTGDTAANNIRAYLKANYLTKGIHYVLLIGNPNPGTGAVPMKMLWPRHASSTYQEAPSDYFYADLTGNWDRDGDGYYGEDSQDFGTGGIDLYPEVIVGRIPYYGTISDLDSILQKIIDYESGTYGGTWVRNVLLSMKPSDSSTPGYNLGEAIRNNIVLPEGLSTTRVYEQTYSLSPAPDYTPCSYANVLAAWQQHAGFHFWWTHGNETTAADIMYSSQTQYLDDKYPSFVFQCSCLNGSPEVTTNLGYSMLKRGAVATDCATRVSWYYPGEVDFTQTGSNASMTYKYAYELITKGLPCGDAHYAMMLDVPNDIWMNHCVFNLYGDPSVACATGPTISHTPLTDTDVTTGYYRVQANIEARNALVTGMPVVKWNTTGTGTFNTIVMTKANSISYIADIPAKPNGTTIYYYIQAVDITGQQAISPSLAPAQPYHFLVRADSTAPAIQHTPLSNTGNTVGPYTVDATVTDNTGVGSVTLYYHKNNGSDVALAMADKGSSVYEAQIPGGTAAGDTISYYIAATDTSLSKNKGRSPSAAGYYSFAISSKKKVAILNCATAPSYFYGSNNNAYTDLSNILSADASQRFQVTVKTSLAAADLSGQDTLVLPDNGPLTADMQSVSDWFQTGKTIVLMDTSACYGAFTGFLWPACAGLNGYGTYWDYNAGVDDQLISLADTITSGYTVGQIIQSRGYHVQFYVDKIPTDVKVLSMRNNNPTRAYAVYRDVPGRGRIVALGPFIPVETDHYSMIREACMGPSTTVSKAIAVTSPNGGEKFTAGAQVTINFQTSGTWQSTEKVKLEYTTGLDSVWRPVSGADSLAYAAGSFTWNTTGLPGSHGYKVRASLVGGSVSDTSDSTFTIVSRTKIIKAKSLTDGELVEVSDAVVTCSTSSYIYIEDANRLGGIRMISTVAPTVSNLLTVTGTISTINGERCIQAESYQVAGVSSALGPFAMKNSALGGSALGGQQAVMEYRMIKDATSQVTSRVFTSAAGLNNVGMLVRVTGKVTYVGSDCFYVNDGSNCDDGSGYIGVRVFSGTLTKPALGKYVALSAISATYYNNGSLFRALVMPAQSDLQVII
ncbi:MAG: C25 family peptidase propeptide domain-containing protein [Armatimonadota bacterium]